MSLFLNGLVGDGMQAEFAASDYKLILKEELAARCKQNPRYSLRAFARDLKLAPSRLSEILSGKQGLSRPAAEKVARALGYASGEVERFCDLVESVHARSKVGREAARVRLKKHVLPTAANQIAHDAFKAIADWYHFGILELMNVDDFKSDNRWIARKLGISEFESQLALDRLTRLNLVQWRGPTVKPANGQDYIPDDIPSDSVKRFHGQILDKAKEALSMQPVEEREFGSEIVAIDSRRLPEAKKMLRTLQHKFCRQVEASPSKDRVYCLAVQFFDLGTRGR